MAIGVQFSGPKGSRSGEVSLEFKGINELMRGLSREGEPWQRVHAAAVQAVTEEAEDLIGRAQRQVPVDEGTLEATGTVVIYADGQSVSRKGPVDQVPGGVEAQGSIVAVAGFNTAYALEQHERLDFVHKNGRKAKYLEDPLKEKAGTYEAHLGEAISGAMTD